MPINKLTCTPILTAALAGKGISGTSAAQLAAAVADGLSNYVNGPLTFTVNAVGTAGVGIGTNVPGSVNVSSAVLSSNILSSMTGAGINGTSNVQFALALASGISQCFLLAIPQIPVPTVGIGTGVGVCIPTSCGPIMAASFASNGMVGSSAPALAFALGSGLDATLLLTPISVVIAGPPSIVPSAGIAINGRFI